MMEENRKLSEEEVKQVSGGTGEEPQKTYKVIEEECIGCAECVFCPKGAIELDFNNVAVIDYLRCDSCGDCVYTCPVDAIRLV
jgi:Pyruvate/2-oxoacid:ferredoxin oxidoreductase delta subunit